MRIVIICTLYLTFLRDDEMKKEWMDRTCKADVGNKKHIQNLSGEVVKEEITCEI
jgi:hypothetical protein